MVGNCIAELHAIFALQHVLTAIGLWPDWMSHRSVWVEHSRQRLRASKCKLTQVSGGWMLHCPSKDHDNRPCHHSEQIVVLTGESQTFVFPAFESTPWYLVVPDCAVEELRRFHLSDNATCRIRSDVSGGSFQVFIGNQVRRFEWRTEITFGEFHDDHTDQPAFLHAETLGEQEPDFQDHAFPSPLAPPTRLVTIMSDDHQIMTVCVPEHVGVQSFMSSLRTFLRGIGIYCSLRVDALQHDRILDLEQPLVQATRDNLDSDEARSSGSVSPEVSATMPFQTYMQVFVKLPCSSSFSGCVEELGALWVTRNQGRICDVWAVRLGSWLEEEQMLMLLKP